MYRAEKWVHLSCEYSQIRQFEKAVGSGNRIQAILRPTFPTPLPTTLTTTFPS